MPPMMSLTLVPARSGSPGRPGHVGEAAHHLHHFVERGAVVVRAGQEALVADVDEARVELRRAPRSRGRTCSIVPGLKFSLTTSALATRLQRDLDAFGRLQVERDALLVAVEHREEAGAGAEQPARAVAVDRLDLDHFGAQVGEHHAAGRAHHHVGELDDADAGVGQGMIVRTPHGAAPTAPFWLCALGALPSRWKPFGRPASGVMP